MSLRIDFLTESDLYAYAEGTLDDEAAETVRRYLEKDPAARRRVERYREEPGSPEGRAARR